MTSNPELTIIIPCYNCEKTLREAVQSCFNGQGVDSFEIVMVDDGSTDTTSAIMQSLAREHDNIRAFSHDKNRGGGAARNTAVAHARADIIFCLDGDDVLPERTLSKMLACLRDKKSDGATFCGSYSFKADISKHKKYDFELPLDAPLRLEYLFQGKGGLGINFMYTKKAFEEAGGYPTDHNFDTQAYGFKFLSSGLVVYACPDTYLYQRQFGDEESYFERAYTSGEFSVGQYMMFKERAHVFSEEVQRFIDEYDIFKNNSIESNIFQGLRALYASDPKGFFATKPPVPEESVPESLYQKGRFDEALAQALKAPEYRNKMFDTIRYAYGVSNGEKMTLKAYKSLIATNTITPHPENPMRLSIPKRAIRKARKEYSKLCAKFT